MPTKTVRVEGYRSNSGSPQSWWVNTGILVEVGDQITFDATDPGGSIKPWGWHPGFDPDGEVDNLTDKNWNESLAYRSGETRCWFGSLIGKVGTDGIAFCIGSSNTITAPATGCLYLAFNDGVNFEDNEGYWDVQVTFEQCVVIPDLFGTSGILADCITTSLLDDWGVILTIQCDTNDPNAVWTTTAINNVVAAFTFIDNRLRAHTSRNFKEVFGGLELRLVYSLPGAAGQTYNGHLVRFDEDALDSGTRLDDRTWGRVGANPGYPSAYGLFNAGDIGIQNTIIHELGHVFAFRAPAMLTWGGNYNLTPVKGSTAETDTGTYWEDTLNDIGEIVPDNFLNWVRDSYVSVDPDVYDANAPDNDRRISAYWIGDIEFVESSVSRGISPGISDFADDAHTAAVAGLAALEVVCPNCIA